MVSVLSFWITVDLPDPMFPARTTNRGLVHRSFHSGASKLSKGAEKSTGASSKSSAEKSTENCALSRAYPFYQLNL